MDEKVCCREEQYIGSSSFRKSTIMLFRNLQQVYGTELEQWIKDTEEIIFMVRRCLYTCAWRHGSLKWKSKKFDKLYYHIYTFETSLEDTFQQLKSLCKIYILFVLVHNCRQSFNVELQRIDLDPRSREEKHNGCGRMSWWGWKTLGGKSIPACLYDRFKNGGVQGVWNVQTQKMY